MKHLILKTNLFNFSKIAFIGLGNMGMNMAKNLVKNGHHQVFGYDIDLTKEQQAKQNHIKLRKDLKIITRDAKIFVLCVPTSQHSKGLCLEQHAGIFENAQKDSLIIDCSTILPSVAVELYQKAKKKNMTYVDAPITGGIIGAKQGTLNFLIGSQNNQVFGKCKQICQSMGKKFFNCHKPGVGQTIKLCNNLAAAIQMIAISEALAMGVKLGVDPKFLTEIMSVSTSNCWALTKQNPIPGVFQHSPASKNYSQGFFAEWMLKDICYAIQTGKSVDANLKIAEEVRDMYQKLIDKGVRKKDFGIIYQLILNSKI